MAGLNWPPEKTFEYECREENELTVEINAYENTEKDIKRRKTGNKKIQEKEGR